MAAEAESRVWTGPSRRRTPRFALQESIDITVLRSGVPDTVPGRSLNLCERGLAAVLSGEVLPGEFVGVEVRLPVLADPLRIRGQVRYQENLRCGLEFVGLSTAQRSAIQDCTRKLRTETEAAVANPVPIENKAASGPPRVSSKILSARKKSRRNYRSAAWIVAVIFISFAAGAFWWKWNRGWEELETGIHASDQAAIEKPQAQVAAEVMEKLLVHRVEPTYPPSARQAKIEGTIALDVVVGRDGSVIRMHPLNGPEVLASAAMDSLRWWKFQPYRINGEPAVVETTLAIEFKR